MLAGLISSSTVMLSPGPAFAAGTVIHPGDQIAVQVFGDQTLTQTVTVLNDGTIEYPLVGRVDVAGKTPDQAAGVLHNKLLKYVRHPVVTVLISQLAQPSVLVLGDVKNPGKYQLRSDGRVSDAVAAAGGLVDMNGAYPVARISDPGGKITQVSLQQLLRGGQTSLDERVVEGSVVYVPGPVQFNVDVAGAVDHPGQIQVNEGDRLSSAIAKAGNSANSQADLNNIRIIRNDPSGKQQQMTVNLYDALKNGNEKAD
ncbi:MAG TPA: polysaccharide biosynthesis/export family protein, partial [Candidatus Baltobacteraceae bacterium]|nr:polysaccharide biosynthesis/export family protein [Candidatus Baltobacteraceae bacterium]